MTQGLLAGTRVVEFAGIGPGPHATMILADLGADVVRVQRPGGGAPTKDYTMRGRVNVEADLKQPGDLADVRALVDRADVLVEGFRPGVMERLGLGPEAVRGSNPGLVYGRMTGWGQTGPWSGMAGHDINYLAVTGALAAIGPRERPIPPLNLIGDFGGGSMLLVVGILAALVERTRTGRGRVVDAAIVDGVSQLAEARWELADWWGWTPEREANLLDGGSPYYRTYRCADGGFVAVGAIEPQFYAELVRLLELDPSALPDRDDLAQWPALSEILAARFAQQTVEHWTGLFAGTDACVTPVLTFDDAVRHPQLAARGTLVPGGRPHAAPAPVFDGVRAEPSPDATDGALGEALSRWRA
jgi:alpha-methylacyl-CoA racemase